MHHAPDSYFHFDCIFRQAKSKRVQSILRWQKRFKRCDSLEDYQLLIDRCLGLVRPPSRPSSPTPQFSSAQAAMLRRASSSSSNLLSYRPKSLLAKRSASLSSLLSGGGGGGSGSSGNLGEQLSGSSKHEAHDEYTNVWRVDLRWLRTFKNDPILSQVGTCRCTFERIRALVSKKSTTRVTHDRSDIHGMLYAVASGAFAVVAHAGTAHWV